MLVTSQCENKLERCGHKPRKANSPQNLKEQGIDSSLETLKEVALVGPNNTDFELLGSKTVREKFVWFEDPSLW